jgi:hypothetical protein
VVSIDQNTKPAVFTRWVNFLDLCAAAVPNGFTADELPTSLQIICRAYAEPLALRICISVRAQLASSSSTYGSVDTEVTDRPYVGFNPTKPHSAAALPMSRRYPSPTRPSSVPWRRPRPNHWKIHR